MPGTKAKGPVPGHQRRALRPRDEGSRTNQLRAVVLAAAFNKRAAYTRSVPTALLPIAGRPLLDLLMDKLGK